MHGAFTTSFGEDEIIESIDVPEALARAGDTAIYKFCRKTGEFAEASAAAVVRSAKRRGTHLPRRAARDAASRSPHWRSAWRAKERLAASTEAVSQRARASRVSDLDAVERRMAAAAVTRALHAGVRS